MFVRGGTRCFRKEGNKDVYRLGKLFSTFLICIFWSAFCIPEPASFVLHCAYSHYSFSFGQIFSLSLNQFFYYNYISLFTSFCLNLINLAALPYRTTRSTFLKATTKSHLSTLVRYEASSYLPFGAVVEPKQFKTLTKPWNLGSASHQWYLTATVNPHSMNTLAAGFGTARRRDVAISDLISAMISTIHSSIDTSTNWILGICTNYCLSHHELELSSLSRITALRGSACKAPLFSHVDYSFYQRFQKTKKVKYTVHVFRAYVCPMETLFTGQVMSSFFVEEGWNKHRREVDFLGIYWGRKHGQKRVAAFPLSFFVLSCLCLSSFCVTGSCVRLCFRLRNSRSGGFGVGKLGFEFLQFMRVQAVDGCF